MDAKEILEQVRDGKMTVDAAEQLFRRAPYEELGYAKLDTHRKLRSGFGEVIFCSGKADKFLVSIFQRLAAEEGEVLGTRATPHQYELVRAACPQVSYDPISRLLKLEKPGKTHIGNIAVCTAGTADIAVAEEAAQTAEFFGSKVTRIYDVGVSGLHRLLANLEPIQAANCVVAVAGMEGALASVIGGLVQNPVIGPTLYTTSVTQISALLRTLRESKHHMAVVVDEYGGTAGIITLEDILEELVGEIWDEHDDVVEDIRQQSDGSWLVSGSASVDDTADELGIKEDGDIDAVAIGGLVQEKLSRLPKVGDKFIWGDFDGTVTRATNRRVQEVRLTPRKVQDEDEK